MTATEEGGSIYSYDSSRDSSTFLREVDGRTFNNQSDLYLLPSDDTEFQRLAKQHGSIALYMGGLTPCPDIVDEILDPKKHTDPNSPATILDLGCGSGIWALEMAQKYPHVSVVGIDIAPVALDTSKIPGNCRFEIGDVTHGLSHYHNRFDVVQARCIAGGMHNYEVMMRDAEACLKPYGVIIFIDGDTIVYLEDNLTPAPVAIDADEPGGPIEGSWFRRFGREVRYAAIYQGTDMEGSEQALDAGLWDHPLIDPTTVHVGGLFTPIGPWATSSNPRQNQDFKYAGLLMQQDVTYLIRAWHPLLKLHGIPADRLEIWTKRADEEIDKVKYHTSFHWRITWGRRRAEVESGSKTSTALSTEDGRLQTDSSMALPELIQASLSQPAHTTDHPLSASTAATTENVTKTTMDFQPLQLRESKEDAERVAALRVEAEKALPVCMLTRLRAAKGLEKSTDSAVHSSDGA